MEHIKEKDTVVGKHGFLPLGDLTGLQSVFIRDPCAPKNNADTGVLTIQLLSFTAQINIYASTPLISSLTCGDTTDLIASEHVLSNAAISEIVTERLKDCAWKAYILFSQNLNFPLGTAIVIQDLPKVYIMKIQMARTLQGSEG